MVLREGNTSLSYDSLSASNPFLHDVSFSISPHTFRSTTRTPSSLIFLVSAIPLAHSFRANALVDGKPTDFLGENH